MALTKLLGTTVSIELSVTDQAEEIGCHLGRATDQLGGFEVDATTKNMRAYR